MKEDLCKSEYWDLSGSHHDCVPDLEDTKKGVCKSNNKIHTIPIGYRLDAVQ